MKLKFYNRFLYAVIAVVCFLMGAYIVSATTASVDHIRMTVYYTGGSAPSTASGTTMMMGFEL